MLTEVSERYGTDPAQAEGVATSSAGAAEHHITILGYTAATCMPKTVVNHPTQSCAGNTGERNTEEGNDTTDEGHNTDGEDTENGSEIGESGVMTDDSSDEEDVVDTEDPGDSA